MSTVVLSRVRTWGDEDILVFQHQPHLPLSGVLIWGTHSLSQAQIKTSGSQSPTNPRLSGPRLELSAPVKSSFSERSRLKVSGIKDLHLLPLPAQWPAQTRARGRLQPVCQPNELPWKPPSSHKEKQKEKQTQKPPNF